LGFLLLERDQVNLLGQYLRARENRQKKKRYESGKIEDEGGIERSLEPL
jgi:hypothetical protein